MFQSLRAAQSPPRQSSSDLTTKLQCTLYHYRLRTNTLTKGPGNKKLGIYNVFRAKSCSRTHQLCRHWSYLTWNMWLKVSVSFQTQTDVPLHSSTDGNPKAMTDLMDSLFHPRTSISTSNSGSILPDKPDQGIYLFAINLHEKGFIPLQTKWSPFCQKQQHGHTHK